MNSTGNDPLKQAAQNRTDIAAVKRKYDSGEITREEARLLAQPIIDRINEATVRKTAELNKKYGMKRKPALLNFIHAMRNSY